MANLHFRSSLNGFNKEDVVRYLEISNTKHENALNQLRTENQALREQLEAALAAAERSEEIAALQAENAHLKELSDTLREEISALETEFTRVQEENARLKEEPAAPAVDQRQLELDAYRRAERAERAAKQRASQMYDEALGILAESTTQVEGQSARLEELEKQVIAAVDALRQGLAEGGNVMQTAANRLYGVKLPQQED